MSDTKYDVAIIGAGPAGCACALSLRDSGLSVILIDKATFPRYKTCGDGITPDALKVIPKISESLAKKLALFPNKSEVYSTLHMINNQKPFTFNWKQVLYVIRRYDFDKLLTDEVKLFPQITFIENCEINSINRRDDIFELSSANNINITAKMVIGCDGNNSIIARQLGKFKRNTNDYIIGITGYYENLSTVKNDCLEIYFDKKYFPGYLWIFPLPNNQANVGFGLIHKTIIEKKINIKETFHSFIAQNKELQKRLKNATLISELKGYGMQTNNPSICHSGEGFLVCGDAASVVDPISGEGIGPALTSGMLAAEQIIKAFEKNNFGAEFLSTYDEQIIKHIYKHQLPMLRIFEKGAKYPYLINIFAFAMRFGWIRKWANKQF